MFIFTNNNNIAKMESYSVRQIAKKSKLNVETIRYYEKIKIMPNPKRRESGYRFYTNDDLARLKFIIRAKELGFTLKEIKELLSIKIDSTSKCGDLKKIAEEKINDITKRIKDLNNIKRHLTKLAAQCVNEELSTDDCPIVKALDNL